MLRFGMAAGVVYAVAFLIGLRWGVIGVAGAYAASGFFLLWYPSWRIAGKIIGLAFSHMVANLGGIFACTVGMSAAVYALQHFVFVHPGWISLLALAGSGAAVYLALVHFCHLAAYLELLHLLREQLAAKRHAG